MILRVCLTKIVLAFIIFLPWPVQSQGIVGRISDKKGKAIPYATIYVPAHQKGTVANEAGEYQLSLEPGTYELVYQYLGYQTKSEKISLTHATSRKDIELELQHYNLAEVIVMASGEDPAYFIMRKAIGMSQYYKNQVSEYNAKVYLKGSGVANKIPLLMRNQLKKEGFELGKYYVTETISDIHFRKGEPLQTKVISTRSTGKSNETSPMQFVALSLYNDINGIISPLSRSAFQVYSFKLEGTFVEDGKTINKIRVSPKRKGQDLYSGTIFIREGSWNLHSVDLNVEQKLFSVRLCQVYQMVNKMVYMPVSHDFDIAMDALGFVVQYKYLISVNFNQVLLNPGIDHNFYTQLLNESQDDHSNVIDDADKNLVTLTKPTIPKPQPPTERQKRVQTLLASENLNNKETRELNKLIKMETTASQPKPSLEIKPRNTEIADSARLRSLNYWKNTRPVPLTEEEKESLGEPKIDTVKVDSLKRKKSKFINEIMFGTYERKLSSAWNLKHNGMISPSSFEFNTVDGFLLLKKARLTKNFLNGKRLMLSGNLDYAFARKQLIPSFEAEYLFAPLQRASFQLIGGKATSDFNAADGILPFFNTFTTLYFKQNYLKLYEKDFIKLQYKTDIVNGLMFQSSIEYANRQQLENNSAFFLTNPLGVKFTSNLPSATAIRPILAESHKAMIIESIIRFTPQNFYRIVDKRKEMLFSRYPTFALIYRQGIGNVGGSSTSFQHFETNIKHGYTWRLVGRFDYKLAAGTFFDRSNLFFADYKHFNNNSLLVHAGDRLTTFRGLDFYENSTGSTYLEAHFQYEHTRILLKRLPFLATSLIRENIFVNSLATYESKPYVEFGYGLNQVFLLFSVEVFSGYYGGRHHYSGFRIGVPLGQTSVRF